MKKIIVASLNPVKAAAALNGFSRMFPDEAFQIDTVSVPSGVSDQPRTDRETLQGAINRARHAREDQPDAHFWVGVEGGIDYLDGQMMAFAWIEILSSEGEGRARTAIFRLPQAVQDLVESGLELGDADDHVFERENSKQRSGAVGLLTGNVISRTALYEQAVVLALVPFMNPVLYFEKA